MALRHFITESGSTGGRLAGAGNHGANKKETAQGAVVYDWHASADTPLTKALAAAGGEWSSLSLCAKRQNMLAYARQALGLFLGRKNYGQIVCWQQIHGILFANLCGLFRVKKTFKLYVLMFIYRREKGIKGWLKHRLFRAVLTGGYIDCAVCYSAHECEHYAKLFKVDAQKFAAASFGIADEAPEYKLPADGGYFLAMGRSSRDYAFLIEAMAGQPYECRIIDNTCRLPDTDNCHIIRSINYGEQLWRQIAGAFAVLVPIKDGDISAGQTAIIQAMMFSKPVIATQTAAVDEYVENGVSGIVLPNDTAAWRSAMQKLKTDKELYSRLSRGGRARYEERYTAQKMAENIADIIKRR